MEPVAKNEMKPLTKVLSDYVHEYFKKTDIELTEDGDRATYEFSADGEGDFTYKCYLEIYEAKQQIRVYEYVSNVVPDRKRTEIAELLVRINFGLKYGKVSMAYDSGKLRFEGEIGVREGLLSAAMINDLVDAGIGILDSYSPLIMKVVYSDVSAEDAFTSLSDNTEAPSIPDAADISQAWAWNRFVGAMPLKAWADDLSQACKNAADLDAWTLAGRACVLINSDEIYSCEALKRVASDAGMKFVRIPPGEVMNMPDSAAFRSISPVMVYLEPGRWMFDLSKLEDDAEERARVEQYQYRLMERLRDFNPKRPVVYAVSASELNDVSEKLRQVGLFERFIAIPDRSLEFLAQDFLTDLGQDICDDSMKTELGKVGKLLSWSFASTEQRDLARIALRRIHAQQNRLLTFLDLVHISTHDLTEEEQPQAKNADDRKQVAYHEAGHAVIAILESGGEDIPDYTSIVPGASGFGGITVESYQYHFSKADKITAYDDLRREIRICLGGRAAEEIAYGPEKIGSGASGDLESATRQACNAFARWGFAPSMQEVGMSESNLAVILGRADESENNYVNGLVRKFLAEEYRVVRQTLTEQRKLLDQVADRLMWDAVVDQEELSELYESYKGKAKGKK